MDVIPVINVSDKEGFKKRVKALRAFLPEGGVIHVDAAHRPFATIDTYAGEDDIRSLGEYEFECHYMGEDLAKAGRIASAFKRVFLHRGWWREDEYAPFLDSYSSKIGIAFSLLDQKDKMIAPSGIERILFLGGTPGKAGQKFDEKSLEVISFLKTKYPHATLTYDGGVNEENILKIKEAGADRVVVASAIWNSTEPANAYFKLLEIVKE
jgi:pentose-5-phosphate-3-epimerase